MLDIAEGRIIDPMGLFSLPVRNTRIRKQAPCLLERVVSPFRGTEGGELVLTDAKCPVCHASWPEYIPDHKIAVKGGFDENYAEAVCCRCGYQSEKYAVRPVIVMDRRSTIQKQPLVAANTEDKRVTFTACKGDIEFNIKVGKEGLSKLISMLMEV